MCDVHPLGLLPDDRLLLEKDDVLAYIIPNNMHMGLRELGLHCTVVVNCAGFGLSG